MNKICTSLEQSKKLMELGIDINTADIIYTTFYDKISKNLPMPKEVYDILKYPIDGDKCTPAWSLSALIELMPDKISINNESYYLSFKKNGVEFRGPITWEGQKSISLEMDNILDAVFEMIVKLKELKLL